MWPVFSHLFSQNNKNQWVALVYRTEDQIWVVGPQIQDIPALLQQNHNGLGRSKYLVVRFVIKSILPIGDYVCSIFFAQGVVPYSVGGLVQMGLNLALDGLNITDAVDMTLKHALLYPLTPAQEYFGHRQSITIAGNVITYQ